VQEHSSSASNESPNLPLVIELIDATKRFPSAVAVDRLSLQVHRGEVFAFLGPNGAGKTTTIKMIVGLLIPSDGEVRTCGQHVDRNRVETRGRIAYVPDQPFVYEKLTGGEFLTFVGKIHGLSDGQIAERSEHLIERLRIGSFLKDLAESYSHGMKQKLVIAAALLNDPIALVIDEPMVGLDPWGVRVVSELLREHAGRGNSVFLSTHTLGVAETVADRIGIIQHGRLIALGNMDDLRQQARNRKNLEEIFLELTEQVPRGTNKGRLKTS
jgi:ABC-2 type transport system ATP-binding protein